MADAAPTAAASTARAFAPTASLDAAARWWLVLLSRQRWYRRPQEAAPTIAMAMAYAAAASANAHRALRRRRVSLPRAPPTVVGRRAAPASAASASAIHRRQDGTAARTRAPTIATAMAFASAASASAPAASMDGRARRPTRGCRRAPIGQRQRRSSTSRSARAIPIRRTRRRLGHGGWRRAARCGARPAAPPPRVQRAAQEMGATPPACRSAYQNAWRRRRWLER